MFRRIFLIGGALAAALVLVVGGLYYVGGRKGGEGSFLDRVASGFQTVTQIGSSTSNEAGGEFVFPRLDIDTSKPQAEACLAFSRGLDLTGRTHYEDYLT